MHDGTERTIAQDREDLVLQYYAPDAKPCCLLFEFYQSPHQYKSKLNRF